MNIYHRGWKGKKRGWGRDAAGPEGRVKKTGEKRDRWNEPRGKELNYTMERHEERNFKGRRRVWVTWGGDDSRKRFLPTWAYCLWGGSRGPEARKAMRGQSNDWTMDEKRGGGGETCRFSQHREAPGGTMLISGRAGGKKKDLEGGDK